MIGRKDTYQNLILYRGEIMEIGDFVDVFFEDCDIIGRLVSDEGDTVTVSIDGNEIYGVPKQYCRPWVKAAKH